MDDKVIIYDWEIYKFDSLLGALILDGDKEILFQSWDEDEMRSFWEEHKDSLWVGHNNFGYDDFILEALVNHKSLYEKNFKIVKLKEKTYLNLPIYSFDLMKVTNKPYSLKLTELLCGKNIHTTDVDFELPRKLTDEERALTENYNADDLYQTAYNYKLMKNAIDFRIEMSKEFGLDLRKGLRVSDGQFGAMILKAKKNQSLTYAIPKIPIYENLILNDANLRKFFENGQFRQGFKYTKFLPNGVEFDLSDGGGHYAVKKVYVPKLIYADVSGYYNRIMIEHNLLPRSISPEGIELYKAMFDAQLKMKKTNPTKRSHYKKVLLAPFGSMKNEYTDFYDPLQFPLVTYTGQLFAIDLMEKLTQYSRIIQYNTDGVMIEPFNWEDEDKIMTIIEEWEERTKFKCKKEHLYNLWQKDVNNYICQEEDGTIITKGEIVKNFDISDKSYGTCEFFNCEEPPIVAQGIVNYLLNGKDVSEFIEENKHNLILFQYPCKKVSATYTTYDSYNARTMEHSTERLHGIDRAFPLKSNEIYGTVIKHTLKNGRHTQAKMPSIPDNVFIYNYELNEEAYEKLKDQIDWSYYEKRIYERIAEFIEM